MERRGRGRGRGRHLDQTPPAARSVHYKALLNPKCRFCKVDAATLCKNCLSTLGDFWVQSTLFSHHHGDLGGLAKSNGFLRVPRVGAPRAWRKCRSSGSTAGSAPQNLALIVGTGVCGAVQGTHPSSGWRFTAVGSGSRRLRLSAGVLEQTLAARKAALHAEAAGHVHSALHLAEVKGPAQQAALSGVARGAEAGVVGAAGHQELAATKGDPRAVCSRERPSGGLGYHLITARGETSHPFLGMRRAKRRVCWKRREKA